MGYGDIQSIVAFSGDVPNKEVQDASYPADHAYNESNMNPGLTGRDIRKVFDQTEYKVLIVANKFQTGFDQPKLVAMYVDKKISGVEAVQTLSRLNRIFPGKDKTYIIDFVNDPEEILTAFQTFHRDVKMADIQQFDIVYDIKQRLDGMMIYVQAEVAAFGNAIVDRTVTHQKLYALTQPATDRYNNKMKALNDAIVQWEKAWEKAKDANDSKHLDNADRQRSELTKERDELMIFSESLGKFVRSYEYIAQLIDFADPELEAFASYARLLRKRLKGLPPEQVDLAGLQLTHYKIVYSGGLAIKENDAEGLYGIADNGMRDPRDRARKFLSELVDQLNAALGKEIGDTDKVAFAVHVSEKLRHDAVVMAQIKNNSREQAMKANLPTAAIQAIVDAMNTHQSLATTLLSDEHKRTMFVNVVYELLAQDKAAELMGAVREG